MALLGNIIWFLLGGWWNFLLYSAFGILCCITIIGIPIGKAMFQYAKLMVFPFGKVIVRETYIKGEENVSTIRKAGGVIANIIWLPCGVIMFLLSVVEMIACAVTIIMIPVAVVIAKSSTFLLWPIGARVITKEQAETIRLEKSLVKVAGTTMAVNARMNQQVVQNQTQSQAAQDSFQRQPQSQIVSQPNQNFENFKAESAKVLGNIKDTSGKAASAIAETSGKAATAFVETSSAGIDNLKNKQKEVTNQILAQKKDVTLDELLIQIEAKLYTNKIMAWIMPFLEYITLAVGAIAMIYGIILTARGGIHVIAGVLYGVIAGILYGIRVAAPLMLLAVILGIIKRSHIFVLTVLGVQLLVNLILGFMGRGFSLLPIICYLGIMIWYVLTFVMKQDFEMPKVKFPEKKVQASNPPSFNNESINTVTPQRRFCGICGTEYTGQIAFCATCGNKLK